MATFVHTIPPPVPECNTQKDVRLTKLESKYKLQKCLWALGSPEIQLACFKARVCTNQPPHKCQLRSIHGIRQSGPTCGLTAISMLMNGTPTSEELLAIAKDLHFTNNGEMFSTQYMLQLLEDLLAKQRSGSNAADHIKCNIHKGPLDCAKIRENILAGACILASYDADFIHEPCLRSGHSAHWALIVGYLIDEDHEFYVLARHGKSLNLAVWSLRKLSESNSNLVEFAQPKGYPDQKFLLPPGGLSGDLGLTDRAIVINNLPHETIIIR